MRIIEYMPTAVHDVINEYERQHKPESEGGEGFDNEHDDLYLMGQLSMAAAAYALLNQVGAERAVELWPWQLSWWKPKGQRRDLVRAAALLISEIARLDRRDHAAKQREADREEKRKMMGTI